MYLVHIYVTKYFFLSVIAINEDICSFFFIFKEIYTVNINFYYSKYQMENATVYNIIDCNLTFRHFKRTLPI